jgi:glycerophosphoryl diester phosphodiesterase
VGKVLVQQVVADFRAAWGLLWLLVALHLTFRLLLAAILLPLAGLVLSVALGAGGQDALTDQDIAWFLASPAGFAGALALASLLIAAAVLDVAAMTAVMRGSERSTRGAIKLSLRSIMPRFPAILHFAARLVLRVLLIAAPFLLAAGAVAMLWLREYDINYYLTYRPPAFLLAAGLIGMLVLAMGLVLLARLSSWALGLHLVLFGQESVAASFAASARLLQGRRATLVGRIVVWLVIRSLLFALVTVAVGVAIVQVPELLGSNLRLIATLGLLLLLAWALGNAVVGACSNGALAHLLDREYRLLGADAGGRDPGRRQPAGGRPAVLAVVLLIAAAGTVAGAFYSARLLDRLGVERDVEVIAHRGAAAVRPENTLAAIVKAVEDRADWVEIDVQENAEGVVVVAHDSDFMKAAGAPVKVWQATTADLADIDIGSWFDAAYAGERTPTLREALLAVKGRGRLLIELKYYGHDVDLEARVVRAVEEAGMAEDVAVMSLDYAGVQKIGALRPAWRRGLLAARAIGDLSRLDADFLAVNTGQVSLRLIRRAHDRGKQVYVWTVDDPVTMSRMISMGVDGLITNDPALARRTVEARNALSTPERLMLWLSDRFDIGSFDLVADESGA